MKLPSLLMTMVVSLSHIISKFFGFSYSSVASPLFKFLWFSLKNKYALSVLVVAIVLYTISILN